MVSGRPAIESGRRNPVTGRPARVRGLPPGPVVRLSWSEEEPLREVPGPAHEWWGEWERVMRGQPA